MIEDNKYLHPKQVKQHPDPILTSGQSFNNIICDIIEYSVSELIDFSFGFSLLNTIKNRDGDLITNRSGEFILWR